MNIHAQDDCIYTFTRGLYIQYALGCVLHTYIHQLTHTYTHIPCSIGALALFFRNGTGPTDKEINQAAASACVRGETKSYNTAFRNLVGACLQRHAGARPSTHDAIARLEILKSKVRDERGVLGRCDVM